MRRLAPLVLVLALALALAACGGSARLSKQAYERRLQQAGTHAQHAVRAVVDPGTTVHAYAKQLLAAQHEMQAAADQLSALEPPADAAADTETIAQSLDYLAAEIGKLQHAAATGDKFGAATVGAAIRSAPELVAATRAAARLQREGYRVGVFGR